MISHICFSMDELQIFCSYLQERWTGFKVHRQASNKARQNVFFVQFSDAAFLFLVLVLHIIFPIYIQNGQYRKHRQFDNKTLNLFDHVLKHSVTLLSVCFLKNFKTFFFRMYTALQTLEDTPTT